MGDDLLIAFHHGLEDGGMPLPGWLLQKAPQVLSRCRDRYPLATVEVYPFEALKGEGNGG